MKIRNYFLITLIVPILFGMGTNAEEAKENNQNWKIEVLVSSPSIKGLESLFGHSALLVIPPGKSAEEGQVWEFQANIQYSDESKWMNVAVGGLTGQFPFIVTEEPALIYFSRHIVYEFRNIQRIIIPTTSQQSQKIVQILESLKKDSRPLSQYYFRTENCMTALLRVLKLAGLPINLNQLLNVADKAGMIPTKLPQILRQLLISYIPPQTSFNLVVQSKNIEKKYKIELKSKIEKNVYLDWENHEKEILKNLEKHELALAAQALSIYDDKRLPYLQKLIHFSKSSHSSFVTLKNFPELFYLACENSSCANDLIRTANRFFEPKELRLITSILNYEYNRSKQIFRPEIQPLKFPQLINWKTLLESILESRGFALTKGKAR